MTVMDREQAIELLKKYIPSFGRKYEDADIYGPLGWLYKTDSKITDVIPEKYLEGISVNRDGVEFKTVLEGSLESAYRNDIPEGRLVRLPLCSYGSNPHLYATLEINGVVLQRKTEKGYHQTFVSGVDLLDHPELANAQSTWKLELGRILPQEEVEEHPRDWDGYVPGSRTMRFLSAKEVLATGLYVSLMKIQGPFFVLSDYGYVSLSSIKKNLVMSVSREGEVSFFNKASFLNP